MRPIIAPLFIIMLGTAWLLNTIEFYPEIDWFLTSTIAFVGIAPFALWGFDKFTFVVGSFFVIWSVLTFLRQISVITLSLELPMLVIIFGTLMLLAKILPIKSPPWVIEHSRRHRK